MAKSKDKTGTKTGNKTATKPARKSGHKDLRKAIIRACQDMNRLGINQGTSGNISARLPDDPGRFLITPSGVPYEAMAPEQIVEMDLDGGYVGDWLPSSEWRMHLDIYRDRPEAGAVVHTHATYCTALSSLRQPIPAFHYMIGVAGGTDIRCAGYATFGTAELSKKMLAALKDRSACLLANHGMICFGPHLDKAMWLAVEVEALATQYWAARQVGEPVILGAAEMKRVLARFKTYGKQAADLAEGEAPAVEAPVRRDVAEAAE
jgi:L-fuculose-phosphate aldolase